MVQYLKNYASLHGLPQTVPPNRNDSEPQIVLSSCEFKQSGFDTYVSDFRQMELDVDIRRCGMSAN